MTLSPDQFSAQHRYAASLYGSGDSDKLFGRGVVTPTPWPSAARQKTGSPYDMDLISRERAKPPELTNVDPRPLHATQPSVLREHVNYYMRGDYNQTGRTARDQHLNSNQYPEIYVRPNGQQDILSGHHRAASALIKGEPLRARVYKADA